jgi:hypothetical protein
MQSAGKGLNEHSVRESLACSTRAKSRINGSTWQTLHAANTDDSRSLQAQDLLMDLAIMQVMSFKQAGCSYGIS